MGKPRAPTPPDPVQLSNAQTQSNIATAREQQRLNLINTQGPQGSVRYSADPNAPGGYTQTTTLSPEQQQAYDRQMGVYNQALGVAGDQIGRVGQSLGQGFSMEGLPDLMGGLTTDFSADRQRVEDALYGRAKARLDEQFGTAERGMDARLAAQGLGINSTASRNLRGDFGNTRNEAYSAAIQDAIIGGGAEQSRLLADALRNSQFNNQARSQGMQERAYAQNLPLQQLQALLGTGQVSMPEGIGYTPSSVSPTDVLGANALNQQGQWNRYNANMSNYQNTVGGLFNLGQAAIMSSDVRVKKDIEKVTTRPDGLGVYRYRYIWDDGQQPLRTGLMAQEVQKLYPQAIHLHPADGHLMVDYGAVPNA
jgi:hypothetical protein